MRLFLDELLKTYRKWRTYIGFLAIAILIPLIQIAMKLEGGAFIRRMTTGLFRDFFFIGNLFNGWFVTNLIMNSLWFHVPFLISLVAGDILAGEATAGTFRILLIRPVSRTRIFITKYAAALFYTWSLVFFLGVLSIGLGLILFGSGDFLVLNTNPFGSGDTMVRVAQGILILPESEAWWRFMMAFSLATLSMGSVASLSVLFSSFVENAIGPIIGTMAVIFGFFIIGNMQISFFQAFKPYLFTSYFDIWTKAFEDPISWTEIARSSLILGGFSFGFVGVAWRVFTRKDIVS